MKLLKLSFILVLAIFFGACGGDDDSSGDCTQADWVGTYTGTQVCNGATLDVTVRITASGTDAIVVIYDADGLESEFDPMTPDGCNIDQTDTDGSNSLTVDATLNGDNLSFKDILTVGGTTVNCDITATRN